MEFDNVPRQPLWLTSLQAEVQARAPFAILGPRPLPVACGEGLDNAGV